MIINKRRKTTGRAKEIPDFPMQEDIRDDYRGILTWREVVNQKLVVLLLKY